MGKKAKSTAPSSREKRVYEECGAALDKLTPLFTDDCRLTLVMRSTTNDECFFVMSKDDLDEVAKTVLRAKEAPRD